MGVTQHPTVMIAGRTPLVGSKIARLASAPSNEQGRKFGDKICSASTDLRSRGAICALELSPEMVSGIKTQMVCRNCRDRLVVKPMLFANHFVSDMSPSPNVFRQWTGS